MRPVPFAEPSGNSEAWRSLRTALRLARESVADVGLSLSSPDLAQPRTTPPVGYAHRGSDSRSDSCCGTINPTDGPEKCNLSSCSRCQHQAGPLPKPFRVKFRTRPPHSHAAYKSQRSLCLFTWILA